MDSTLIEYFLDADIAVHAMQGHPEVAYAWAAVAADRIGISALVHSQLLQGLVDPVNRDSRSYLVDTLLRRVVVLPYDRDAAIEYGRVVQAIGHSRQHATDRMIAAHAIAIGATFVTANTKDFARIPNLKLVNWADPSPAA